MEQGKTPREKMREAIGKVVGYGSGEGDSGKRAVETAKKIGDLLNSFSVNEKAIGMALVNEHRTLQQTFARVAIEYFKALADSEYYDGRNEGAYNFAKDIRAQLDDARLPMI